MVHMEDTIRLIRERDLPIKVMVGGAAVTQAFADAIGADAYCPDAVCAVRAAKTLSDFVRRGPRSGDVTCMYSYSLTSTLRLVMKKIFLPAALPSSPLRRLGETLPSLNLAGLNDLLLAKNKDKW